MTTIGYARVSTDEQSLDLQLDALRNAGCERVFQDEGISATARLRPGFAGAIAMLNPGSTLVDWKMDRAFRSVMHAASTLEVFALHDITLQCLTEPVDTSTPMGRCMYHIRNAFAEWERELIRERTVAGVEAARRRGVRIGRPRKLSENQIREIRFLLNSEPDRSRNALAVRYGVSTRTLQRAQHTRDA